MKARNSNKIPFGLKDGKLVHISQVDNGLNCGCVCPNCNAPLEANQGHLRSYFSHAPGYSQCTGAEESTMHLMAKEVMSDSRCICLPPGGPMDGIVNFDKVEVEIRDDESSFRPDCIGYCGNDSIWIEFKYTHSVSSAKQQYIVEKGIYCIEVDISKCKLDYTEMESFITKQTAHRVWIREKVGSATPFNGLSLPLSQEMSTVGFDDSSQFSDLSSLNIDLLKESDSRIRYAYDEKHRFVDVRRCGKSQKLFCLVCGSPITTEGCSNDNLGTVAGQSCMDRYLKITAREFLYSKFNNESQFNIEISGSARCVEWNGCKYRNEKTCCSSDYKKVIDIKKSGFVTCIKNYRIPGTLINLDLAFVSSNNSVIGIEICDNEDDYYADWLIPGIRVIKIPVLKLHDLSRLEFDPLRESSNRFFGFSLKDLPSCNIEETTKTFKVFYVLGNGDFYYEDVHCYQLRFLKEATECYIIFRGNPKPNDVKYGLLRCRQLGMRVCACEVCYFFGRKGNGTDLGVCKRYKTKGTPRYPLGSRPTTCDHFGMNYELERELMWEYQSVELEEFKK